VRPIGPAFTNVNSSVVGEEGAVISWEYFGPDKNVYVEYIVENSKLFLLLYNIVSSHHKADCMYINTQLSI
jgi:hypothetical protein